MTSIRPKIMEELELKKHGLKVGIFKFLTIFILTRVYLSFTANCKSILWLIL
jgi:uncharacterized membrane protein (DUF485 family)